MNRYTLSNSSLRICMDLPNAGTIYGQRLTAPLPFHTLSDLILKIDAVLDQQNFPQAYLRTRTFSEKTANDAIALSAPTPQEGMSRREVQLAQGRLITFDILVATRRNATWQGSIIWQDTAAQEFSSDLELLRLIDARLTPPA
ncbi:MAG: hypothetical protein RR053_02935 [Evtepia sp.]